MRTSLEPKIHASKKVDLRWARIKQDIKHMISAFSFVTNILFFLETATRIHVFMEDVRIHLLGFHVNVLQDTQDLHVIQVTHMRRR
jgi:hypothetical protein